MLGQAAQGGEIILFPKNPFDSQLHVDLINHLLGQGLPQSDDVGTVLLLVALAEVLLERQCREIRPSDCDELQIAAKSLSETVALCARVI